MLKYKILTHHSKVNKRSLKIWIIVTFYNKDHIMPEIKPAKFTANHMGKQDAFKYDAKQPVITSVFFARLNGWG